MTRAFLKELESQVDRCRVKAENLSADEAGLRLMQTELIRSRTIQTIKDYATSTEPNALGWVANAAFLG